MKNTKFSKILVLVLTLALVIGAAFGIGTMAEGEEPAVEIVAQNVSYGGSISIMYAVKSTGLADGQYVVIEGSAFNPVDETTEAFTVSDFETTDYDVVVGEENFGKLPVYYTPGIPLKNMATTVTAKAVVYNADNSKAAESASLSYSVLEYLYERQFMFDSVNSAEQKKLYSLMLETGDTVQKVLENYGAGFAPSDYAFATIEGGTVSGLTKGIVPKGTTVTLTGNDAGFIVTPLSVGDDYEIVEGTPVFVANNGTYTINTSVKATPEVFELGEGKIYNSYVLGQRVDFSDESQMNVVEWSANNTYSLEIVDGVEIFGKDPDATVEGEEYIFWEVPYASAYAHYTRESLVWEADVKFDNITSEDTAFSKIYFRTHHTVSKFTLTISELDGRIRIGSSTFINKGQWYNIALVANPDFENNKANIDIYVNGEYMATDTVSSGVSSADSSKGKVHLYLYKQEQGSISLDNVYYGYTYDATADGGKYFNDSSIESSSRKDYEDGTPADIWNDNDTTVENTVVNGMNKYEIVGSTSTNQLHYYFGNKDTTGFENKTIVFEADVMFNKAWANKKPNFRFRAGGYDFTVATDVWNGTGIYIPASGGAFLYDGLWYNLRFEFYETETAGTFNYKVYLNDTVKYTGSVTGTATAANDMLFQPNGSAQGCGLYIDNVFYDFVDLAYTE